MARPTSHSTSEPPIWRPRSHAAILTRAVHLLDLDQLVNCPAITESTFSTNTSTSSATASLQHRIKSAEWLLYQLLTLHDPEETHARLAPNIPPTSTPMQSLSLRAALYRYLAELKKNGTLLPREVVLRKTMLDECRGERFEELLAGIAMGVLRRVVVRRQAGRGGGGRGVMVERRVYAPASASVSASGSASASGHGSGSGSEKRAGTGRGRGGNPATASVKYTSQTTIHRADHLILPLLLAHRVSLQHSLKRRQNIRQNATADSQHLARLRDDIEVRNRRVSSQPDTNQEEISGDEYEALRTRLVRAFGPDRRWVEYLFHGAPGSDGVSLELPEWPFDDDGQASLRERDGSLHRDCAHHGIAPEGSDVELDVEEPMIHLQRSVAEHLDNIRRLQHICDSLAAAGARIEKRTGPERASSKIEAGSVNHHIHIPVPVLPVIAPAATRFNRHQALTVNSH